MFGKLAVRDALLIALAAALWTWAGPLSAGTGMVSDFAGLLVGLSLAASAYLLHEWGHLLGGLAARSRVHAPERRTSISLFRFDSRRNSRRQFLVMSFSGFAVTGIVLWVAYALLPDEQLASRVARGGVLVLTFLTVFVEFPLVLWSLVSSTLPPVETFTPRGGEEPAAAGTPPT